MSVDYYEVLGVSRRARHREIRDAFRRNILLHHPDRNQAEGSDAKTRLIIEAWEVLKSPESRRLYNQSLNNYAHSLAGAKEEFEKRRRQANDAASVMAGMYVEDILKEEFSMPSSLGGWLAVLLVYGIAAIAMVCWVALLSSVGNMHWAVRVAIGLLGFSVIFIMVHALEFGYDSWIEVVRRLIQRWFRI